MGICLLVVNDDLTCRYIVSQMLKWCAYEELHIGRLMFALKAICEKRDRISTVVTNVHRLGEKGSEILNLIREHLNFEIFYMTPDNENVEWKGEESSGAAYIVNVSNVDDMNDLWEFAFGKNKAANQEGNSSQMASTARGYVTEESRENIPSVGDGSGIIQNQKRKEPNKKSDDHPVERKPRMVWTWELHKKFLEAIEKLGPLNAFPRKIVELMNEPGLTRDNVASHLQKHRLCLKRNQEALYTNTGVCPRFPSFHSAFSINSLQRYSHVMRQPYGFPFQQGPCGSISMPALGHPHPFTAPGSSWPSMSNLTLVDLQGDSNQGIQQQLSSPNLSSGLATPQKNNFVHFANPQCSDHPMDSNFKTSGAQTQNTLLLTEGGSSSSDATMLSNSQNVNNFIGLRFADDGKSLKFGHTSFFGDDDNKTEICSSIGTSIGTESPDHFYDDPLASASYMPDPIPLLGTSGNGAFGQEPSSFTHQIPPQESSTAQVPSVQNEIDDYGREEDIMALLNELGCSSL